MKMKINRSAENCLTTVFPLFLRFVQRFCADEWLHYAEICKKTPKNCRLHTHTHRLTYVHMLYEKAGTWAWAGAMPRCGNYFFLCENKWNLHDTWVILHVNCFFWQTTQANTQDQAGWESVRERGEGKANWNGCHCCIFGVYISAAVPSRVSRSLVEHSPAAPSLFLVLLLPLLLLYLPLRLLLALPKAETNFTFSVCV